MAHSLHAYFILPGDIEAPIVYDVDRIRDGGSFTTRRIRAIQHGPPIFNMSASFQRVEAGHEHQTAMPDVPGPGRARLRDLDAPRASPTASPSPSARPTPRTARSSSGPSTR